MSDHSEEELERAKRIQRLREGRERGRTRRRRPRSEGGDGDDGEQARAGAAESDDEAADGSDGDAVAGPDPEGARRASGEDAPGPTTGGRAGSDDGRVRGDRLLELAADLPEGASLLVVPARAGLRRRLNRVAEQLHLRYGFEFGAELDKERHVRPLALALGIEALEDRDVETVRRRLETSEELDGPDHDDELPVDGADDHGRGAGGG